MQAARQGQHRTVFLFGEVGELLSERLRRRVGPEREHRQSFAAARNESGKNSLSLPRGHAPKEFNAGTRQLIGALGSRPGVSDRPFEQCSLVGTRRDPGNQGSNELFELLIVHCETIK